MSTTPATTLPRNIAARATGSPRALPPWALAPLLSIGGAKLLLHLLLGGRYGYFRDELYFLDCGRHLDWGYVDHAPMVALMARFGLLLGGSLHAIRLLPALAGAATVVIAMGITRELAGRSFAQAMAGLCVLLAPVYLGTDSILSMNALEPVLWMSAAWVLIRILRTGNPRLWLWFGVLTGLGLETKHSTVFFGMAIVAGLLLTRHWRQFATPWPWIGGAVAFALFLPNIIWQVRHHFPTLELLENIKNSDKNVVLGPVQYFVQQWILLHPVVSLVWLIGLGWLLVGGGTKYRPLGYSYLVLLSTFVALKGKNYYLAPIYPMLLAAGAVVIENRLDRVRTPHRRMWAQAAVVAMIIVAAVPIAPIALPLLPPEKFVAYSQAMHVSPPKTETHHQGQLPQLFGDQFGWEELVREVARIYHDLPPDEQARAAIFANNYGEAGAINQFGPRYGLPRAISAHQNYYFWGPQGATGEVMIVLQDDRETLERICASVEEAGYHYHPWGMGEENGPIFVCRGLKPPLPEMWPRLKKWR